MKEPSVHDVLRHRQQYYLVLALVLAAMNAGIVLISVPRLWASEKQFEVCYDGVDNDGNGAADCEDEACFGLRLCTQTEKCDDSDDNDGDGRIDCVDTDCYGSSVCPRSELCGDGVDNDIDGYIDCVDSDCERSPVCPRREICDDGIDNDDNARTDCEDEACTLHASCLPVEAALIGPNAEVIRQVIQRIYIDSQGGLTPEPEKECQNAFDDDSNGKTDCEDDNCLSHPACIIIERHQISDIQIDVADE